MRKMSEILLSSNAGFGVTLLRIIIGVIFIAHGAQKLFGVFGGYGIEGTAGFMVSIGLTPGYLMAFLAGAGEFFGGLLLIFGLLTRVAAAITMIISLVALLTVHLFNGFFMSNNGFEFILLLLVASISLLFSGSGKLGIDQLIKDKFGN
jgi:putative oxidoreductase